VKKIGLLFSFILCLLISTNVLGQGGTPSKVSTAYLLEDLSKGVLIVRIATERNKINKLKEIVNNPSLSEKQRIRFEETLDEIVKIQAINQKNIIEGFKADYTFSEFRFVPDTLFKQVNTDNPKGIFLNPDTYELDPNSTLDENLPVYFLRSGDYRLKTYPYFISGVIMTRNFVSITHRDLIANMSFGQRVKTLGWSQEKLVATRSAQVPNELNLTLHGFRHKLHPLLNFVLWELFYRSLPF